MPAPIQLLIAEDNDDDAVLVVDRLRRSGLTVEYERVETLDAVTAALLRPTLPDLLICDHNLPGFSPEDVLKVLHDHDLDVPFVLVSGQIGEESAAALMRAGAHDFVLKDGLTRLAPAIQRELREADERRQRRQAESALRESEERFRLLAEHAQDIIFRCRLVPYPEVEYLSPAITAITGYEPTELYGDPALVFKTVLPEDQPLLERSWFAPGPDPLVVRWQRRDGEVAWMEQRAVGIRDADGRLVAVQGILRDVTERVRTEHERSALEAQLHQAQRLESLGQLAGGVAHDFNNILAVILNYAAFVAEEVSAAARTEPGGMWEAVRRDVEQIERAAERATTLTHQLLAFGRREVVQPRVLNLNESVTAVEQLLHRTIGEHVRLVTTLAEDLWPVLADPGQIEQVLVNLAVNARDAIPTDGGTLTIDTGNTVVSEAYAHERPGLEAGPSVRLRVSDTGTGMERDVVEHAFEPFFTTKPKGTGTGLGLATVYGIVTQAGGHIQIFSKPGIGTTFTVLLPVTDEVAVPVEEVASYPRSPNGETVLLVEDEDALREVTRRILVRGGYQVIAAESGPEALAIASTYDGEIQLLLTDVVMPHMLGKELAQRLLAVRPATRVLFMSGYAQPILASQGRLDPGVSLLEKPFSEATLLVKAGEVLAAEAPGFHQAESP
jgi:two-component system cell cycle sensor histidine kinase/response regulator CckA